jgi:hypothetical protein
MDDFHFDEVARSLAGGGETRRGLLRLVAGGVLGGVTSRLGLAAGAAAKSGKHRRQRQGAANRNEALQAEGKRKKCKKRKPQLCDPYCEEEGGPVLPRRRVRGRRAVLPRRENVRRRLVRRSPGSVLPGPEAVRQRRVRRQGRMLPRCLPSTLLQPVWRRGLRRGGVGLPPARERRVVWRRRSDVLPRRLLQHRLRRGPALQPGQLPVRVRRSPGVPARSGLLLRHLLVRVQLRRPVLPQRLLQAAWPLWRQLLLPWALTGPPGIRSTARAARSGAGASRPARKGACDDLQSPPSHHERRGHAPPRGISS